MHGHGLSGSQVGKRKLKSINEAVVLKVQRPGSRDQKCIDLVLMQTSQR